MIAQKLGDADDSNNYYKVKKNTIINPRSDLNVTLNFKMKTDYEHGVAVFKSVCCDDEGKNYFPGEFIEFLPLAKALRS
jgi:hypothetical protein